MALRLPEPLLDIICKSPVVMMTAPGELKGQNPLSTFSSSILSKISNYSNLRLLGFHGCLTGFLS